MKEMVRLFLLVFFIFCVQLKPGGAQSIFETTIDFSNVWSDSAAGGCTYQILSPCNDVYYTEAAGIIWTTQENSWDLYFTQDDYDTHRTDGCSYVSNPNKIIGQYTCKLTGLQPGTTYCVRAFALIGCYRNFWENYGNTVTFTTPLKNGLYPITNNSISSGNQYLCVGGTATQYTLSGSVPVEQTNDGTAIPGTFTYAWFSSTDNSNFSPAQGINNAKDYVSTQVSYLGAVYYKRKATFTSAQGITIENTSETIAVTGVAMPTLYVSILGNHEKERIPELKTPPNGQWFEKDSLIPVVGINYSCFVARGWNMINYPKYLQSPDSITFSDLQFNGFVRNNSYWDNGIYRQVGSNTGFYKIEISSYGLGCPTFSSRVMGISNMDGDSSVYPYVKIGHRYWMINNLSTTRFNDGTRIRYITDQAKWSTTSKPACSGLFDSSFVDLQLGLAYNWYVITSNKNVCPVGWRVPTHQDWLDLSNTAGGLASAGASLALSDEGYPIWPYANGIKFTDKCNFNAVPTGYMGETGGCTDSGGSSVWWESTNMYNWDIVFNSISLYNNQGNQFPNRGYYIRCVKDAP